GRRVHRPAPRILHVAVGDVVVGGVDQFNVAQRSLVLLHVGGDPVVALGAAPDGPVDGGRVPGARQPLLAHLRKVIGPDVGGAAAVGPVDDREGAVGEAGVWVQLH